MLAVPCGPKPHGTATTHNLCAYFSPPPPPPPPPPPRTYLLTVLDATPTTAAAAPADDIDDELSDMWNRWLIKAMAQTYLVDVVDVVVVAH